MTANLRTVTNHASAVTYLVARRTELLALAAMNVEQADKFLAAGDMVAADEMLAVAREQFTDAERLAA